MKDVTRIDPNWGRKEWTVETFRLPNAMGDERTIVIKKNGYGRYTWRLIYQDNPVLADQEFQYTHHWFDDAKAARRSARRFTKTLGQ